ncbi:MAG: Holliday junction branch migration protein RuvA [Halothiobacillaceae bacterium]
MIGRLTGRIVDRQPPHLLIDVNGVGYEVEAPMSTFYALQDDGPVVILTHLVVREDAQLLYGFSTERERALFRSLIRVSGVGPRMALAILSGMTAEQFRACIYDNDTAALIRLPGVGRKTAERLVVEMRDRIDRFEGAATVRSPGAAARAGSSIDEAVDALVALGYKPPEAGRMIRSVEGADELPTEELIRSALQRTVK